MKRQIDIRDMYRLKINDVIKLKDGSKVKLVSKQAEFLTVSFEDLRRNFSQGQLLNLLSPVDNSHLVR